MAITERYFLPFIYQTQVLISLDNSLKCGKTSAVKLTCARYTIYTVCPYFSNPRIWPKNVIHIYAGYKARIKNIYRSMAKLCYVANYCT